jgi:transcriptional regulator with XRE-family HTH domain
MPRPLKNVPADTLGGKIRAARQRLRLSLSEVAGDTYSTSLISQIERNKIEPSLSSLKYLAQKLNLSYDELAAMAQQNREIEEEATTFQHLDELRQQAERLLSSNLPKQALLLLENLAIAQIPALIRWRIMALRGQCHFALRKFVLAQRDFLAALDFIPTFVPPDQQLDAILLRLHLAATSRELGHYTTSYEQYAQARDMMDTSTPLRYLAEAHWGISLVLYELAYKSEDGNDNGREYGDERNQDAAAQSGEHGEQFRKHMEHALKHAERASALYDSADELMRATLLDCQIALIEQALGHLDAAHKRLSAILELWLPTLDPQQAAFLAEKGDKKLRYGEKERANVVSACACYLANIEMEEHHCREALAHIEQALQAARQTYILRRADAYMMKGQILANCDDPGAEGAFQQALAELKTTDRLGAKIRVHRMLGAYYLKHGEQAKGDSELDKAFKLANVPSQFNETAANENSLSTYQDQEG